MEAYSQDLRQRIVQACDEALETRQEIADRFEVSTAFIRRLLQRRRETGSIAARPRRGGCAPALRHKHLDRLRQRIRDRPDATLAELCHWMAEHKGPSVSVPTLCRSLRKLGLVRKKKSLHASEQETPRIRRLRRNWRKTAATIDPHKLVFVDESGATTAMARTRGRAPAGQRVTGAVPHGHWQVMTLLGAIRLSGLAAASSILCPTDRDVFRAFVSNALAPVLRAGDVVVWDNLSPHKATGVAEAVEQAGARLLPLPPYSPDFSPIEPCWSKVKEHLRTAAARTPEHLGEAATQAFAEITPQDACGWFKHCGYVLH